MSRQPEHDIRREAHQEIEKKLTLLQGQVLRAIGNLAGTGSSIAQRLNIPLLTVRPRLVELRDMGKIEPTGRRVPNASGRNETEYQLKTTRDDHDQKDLFGSNDAAAASWGQHARDG